MGLSAPFFLFLVLVVGGSFEELRVWLFSDRFFRWFVSCSLGWGLSLSHPQ